MGNKFRRGLIKGNPVRIRSDPVTVLAGSKHDATGVSTLGRR